MKRHGGKLVDEAGSGEGGEASLKTLAAGTPCARGVNEAERKGHLLGLVSVEALPALRVALALALVLALALAFVIFQKFGEEQHDIKPPRRVAAPPVSLTPNMGGRRNPLISPLCHICRNS